jgi:hypothetical protein
VFSSYIPLVILSLTNQCKITVQIIPEEGNLRRKDVHNNALIRAKNKEKKQKQNDKINA